MLVLSSPQHITHWFCFCQVTCQSEILVLLMTNMEPVSETSWS